MFIIILRAYNVDRIKLIACNISLITIKNKYSIEFNFVTIICPQIYHKLLFSTNSYNIFIHIKTSDMPRNLGLNSYSVSDLNSCFSDLYTSMKDVFVNK